MAQHFDGNPKRLAVSSLIVSATEGDVLVQTETPQSGISLQSPSISLNSNSAFLSLVEGETGGGVILGTQGSEGSVLVQAVAEGLAVQRAQGKLAHLVVDTVMVSKSGDDLLTREAIAMLIEAVLPLATMMTPNLPEAGALLRSSPPDSLREMQRAAERLRRLLPDNGQCWVLLKGGHLTGDAVDLLHDGDRMIEFSAPRIETRNTHGTGCSLSAAIAALLPRTEVPDAVDQAKRWLTEAIRRSGELTVGQGHGPVHHFHRLWSR